MMTDDDIRETFTRLRERNPKPTTELHYSNPFELLIAVMLSAQATDVSVNKAAGPLFRDAPTPQAMLALGEDGLKTYIKTIGLFNSKAANVIKTCLILLEKHGGEVPRRREDLEALPGVGRKTANVVLPEQCHNLAKGGFRGADYRVFCHCVRNKHGSAP